VITRLTKGLVRLGLRAFFREIEVRGAENLPPDGPCIVAANHHNSMIDPFLLLAMLDRPLCFIAKEPLFRMPVLGWFLRRLRCIPAHRSQDPGYAKEKNDALYAAAAETLSAGPALALFPEGKSHSEPQLAEFRHGASKIALETESRRSGVRVQLVGLHYEQTRGFRGRVLLQLGPPVAAAGFLDRYRTDSRAGVAALTEELQHRLSEMILTAESREVLRLADLLARMRALQEKGRPHETAEAFDRKKLILDRYRILREREPHEVERLRLQLSRYESILARTGLNEENVGADLRVGGVLGSAVGNTLLLALGLPFLALGIATNFLPYLLAWLVAILSTRLPDRRASAGFLAGLAAFPLYWAGLAAWTGRRWGLDVGLGVAAIGPLSGVLALHSMDRWHEVFVQSWALWLSLVRPSARAMLRRMRSRALARADRLLALVADNPARIESPGSG
jgi:glycerol-3-phosphate O-acyltransferase / dihydroxyacetone phosphate acyltransferase